MIMQKEPTLVQKGFNKLDEENNFLYYGEFARDNEPYQKSPYSSPGKDIEHVSQDDSINNIIYQSTEKIAQQQDIYLDPTSPKSANFEKKMSSNIDSTRLDTKLLHKELAMKMKLYNESQAKSISMTKELSKVQHENSLLQLQLKKSDLKYKEILDNYSAAQTRINELTFLNTQLTNELAKLRMETHEANSKTKDNLDKLKKSLCDVEILIENRNKNIIKCIQNGKMVMYSMQQLMQNQNGDMDTKYLNGIEKFEGIMKKILDIIAANNTVEIKNIENSEEYNAITYLNDTIFKYGKESIEMKEKISDLTKELQKEQNKTKSMIQQYQDSINRLKNNTNMMRNRLKDFQEIKEMEAKELECKNRNLEKLQQKLISDNEALKRINEELNTSLVNKNEKIEKLESKLKDLGYKLKEYEHTRHNADVGNEKEARGLSSSLSSSQSSYKKPNYLSSHHKLSSEYTPNIKRLKSAELTENDLVSNKITKMKEEEEEKRSQTKQLGIVKDSYQNQRYYGLVNKTKNQFPNEFTSSAISYNASSYSDLIPKKYLENHEDQNKFIDYFDSVASRHSINDNHSFRRDSSSSPALNTKNSKYKLNKNQKNNDYMQVDQEQEQEEGKKRHMGRNKEQKYINDHGGFDNRNLLYDESSRENDIKELIKLEDEIQQIQNTLKREFGFDPQWKVGRVADPESG